MGKITIRAGIASPADARAFDRVLQELFIGRAVRHATGGTHAVAVSPKTGVGRPDVAAVMREVADVLRNMESGRKAREGGRRGGTAKDRAPSETVVRQHRELRIQATLLRRLHPDWSDRRLARRLAREHPYQADSIRPLLSRFGLTKNKTKKKTDQRRG